MTDSPYKCTDHRLNIACLGCIKAIIAQRDKLLSFIKKIVRDGECNPIQAEKLLREIGEIK